MLLLSLSLSNMHTDTHTSHHGSISPSRALFRPNTGRCPPYSSDRDFRQPPTPPSRPPYTCKAQPPSSDDRTKHHHHREVVVRRRLNRKRERESRDGERGVMRERERELKEREKPAVRSIIRRSDQLSGQFFCPVVAIKSPAVEETAVTMDLLTMMMVVVKQLRILARFQKHR
ncbi:hypothetical protein Hanom_Chr07g00614871 [Helianthus anomalus]